jgi:sulfotransferase famil protein
VICSKYRCVFVHVPKTAGISVEHVFLGLRGLTWETRAPLLLRHNDDPTKGPPRLAHLKATEYVRCGYLTQQEFASYFKFSFVRNPWDRIVSEYKYRGHPVRMDFKTYLFKHLPAPGFTDTYCHIIPQHDFLFDEQGTLLVDFVGRYESLQADFDTVCARLGIPAASLPHVNRSLEGQPRIRTLHDVKKGLRRWLWNLERKHTFPYYTQYYDDESRAFVAQLFRKDIDAFNYSFGEDRARR